MNRSGVFRLVVLVAVVSTLAAVSGIANAGITWAPTNGDRSFGAPRVWNNNGAAAQDQLSGQTYPGTNTVAVSSDGTYDYIHAVVMSDGAGGAMDYNDMPGRTFKYPYFGAIVSYGGNDAPIRNLNAYGSPYYWEGDCGVMRPHLFTDDFGKYKGGFQVENLGASATGAFSAGVATITSTNLAHFDGVNVGDRVQLGAGTASTDTWLPTVFNRTVRGAGPASGNFDPISNAPYWKVASVPAWNQITLTPDTATAQPALAWYDGDTHFTGVNTHVNGQRVGSVNMFQGAAVGERVRISGATPSTYNGDWVIDSSPSLTPFEFTANPINGLAEPTDGMSSGNVTRLTDNYITHSIKGATRAGGTFRYLTDNVTTIGTGENVTVSGMVPTGWNITGNVTASGWSASGYYFEIANAGTPAAPTTVGIATVNSSPAATQIGTMIRGSDCSKVFYVRSRDDGVNWDGGGETVAGATGCTPSATCPSSNAFLVSGGPTNGDPDKSYLTELGAGEPTIQTFHEYVYVTFQVVSGDLGYGVEICPNDPRVEYIRVNNHYGDTDSWGPPIRITPSNGQLNLSDFTVDQSTGYLYLLYTDAVTGDIILLKSTNQGTTWVNPTTGGKVDINNYVYYSTYLPPDDPNSTKPPNPGIWCHNQSRILSGTGPSTWKYSDSWGYGLVNRVAAYADNVAVGYLKNAKGDRLVVKVSINGGTTFTHARCGTADPCSIHLANKGAGTLGPGFGGAPGDEVSCPWDYGVASTSPICNSNANDADFAMVAGPAETGTRIDFAWVQDGNDGKGWNTVVPNGLYFKEWTSANGWAPERLVACSEGKLGGPKSIGEPDAAVAISAAVSTTATRKVMNFTYTVGAYRTITTSSAHGLAQGDTVLIKGVTPDYWNGVFRVFSVPDATHFNIGDPAGGTAALPNLLAWGPPTATAFGTAARVNGGVQNDPCIGKPATTYYKSFNDPRLALWGTTGVGVTFVGCRIQNGTTVPTAELAPCSYGDPDWGPEILYKESGNSGAAWGADWSTAGGGENSCKYGAESVGGSYACLAQAWDVANYPYTKNPIGTSEATFRGSYAPDLVLDNPTEHTVNAPGCGQQAGGAPSVGCKRYVMFVGLSTGSSTTNPNYSAAYVTFLIKGTQT